jgi:hypothetical protein
MPDHHPLPFRNPGAGRPVLAAALLALIALSIATIDPSLVSAILGVGVLLAILAGIGLLTYTVLIGRRGS